MSTKLHPWCTREIVKFVIYARFTQKHSSSLTKKYRTVNFKMTNDFQIQRFSVIFWQTVFPLEKRTIFHKVRFMKLSDLYELIKNDKIGKRTRTKRRINSIINFVKYHAKYIDDILLLFVHGCSVNSELIVFIHSQHTIIFSDCHFISGYQS